MDHLLRYQHVLSNKFTAIVSDTSYTCSTQCKIGTIQESILYWSLYWQLSFTFIYHAYILFYLQVKTALVVKYLWLYIIGDHSKGWIIIIPLFHFLSLNKSSLHNYTCLSLSGNVRVCAFNTAFWVLVE